MARHRIRVKALGEPARVSRGIVPLSFSGSDPGGSRGAFYFAKLSRRLEQAFPPADYTVQSNSILSIFHTLYSSEGCESTNAESCK